MRTVSNASPLIILAKAGILDVLEKLFGKVTVTDMVYDEIMELESYGIITQDMRIIRAARFIREFHLDAKARADVIRDSKKYEIGVGEMSVARVFLDEKYDVALIEDKIAKDRLKRLGVKAFDIWDIAKLAHKKRILSIKSFARSLYNNSKYTSHDIEKVLGRSRRP